MTNNTNKMVLKRSFSHLVHKMSKTTYFISRQLLILRVPCTFFHILLAIFHFDVFEKIFKGHISSFNLIRLKPCQIGYLILKNQWVSLKFSKNSSSNIFINQSRQTSHEFKFDENLKFTWTVPVVYLQR